MKTFGHQALIGAFIAGAVAFGAVSAPTGAALQDDPGIVQYELVRDAALTQVTTALRKGCNLALDAASDVYGALAARLKQM